jgi:hypothetical protein
MSVAAAGALAFMASDGFMAGGAATVAGMQQGASASQLFVADGSGSTTFTAQYRRDAGTASFSRSTIIVQIFD